MEQYQVQYQKMSIPVWWWGMPSLEEIVDVRCWLEPDGFTVKWEVVTRPLFFVGYG